MSRVTSSRYWRAVFRHGLPRNARDRMRVVLSNVFLHIHPTRVTRAELGFLNTFCLGGLSFLMFLVVTLTGVALMLVDHDALAVGGRSLRPCQERAEQTVERLGMVCRRGLDPSAWATPEARRVRAPITTMARATVAVLAASRKISIVRPRRQRIPRRLQKEAMEQWPHHIWCGGSRTRGRSGNKTTDPSDNSSDARRREKGGPHESSRQESVVCRSSSLSVHVPRLTVRVPGGPGSRCRVCRGVSGSPRVPTALQWSRVCGVCRGPRRRDARALGYL